MKGPKKKQTPSCSGADDALASASGATTVPMVSLTSTSSKSSLHPASLHPHERQSNSDGEPDASPCPGDASHNDTLSASPHVAGAEGGSGPPTSADAHTGSKFDDAVSEADSDFTQLPSNQPTNQQQNQIRSAYHTQTPNHSHKFLQGNNFPRFLVVKHKDPSKTLLLRIISQFQMHLKMSYPLSSTTTLR